MPKYVIILCQLNTVYYNLSNLIAGTSCAHAYISWGVTQTIYATNTSNSYKNSITYTGTTMSWHNKSATVSEQQMNKKGTVYDWIAIYL